MRQLSPWLIGAVAVAGIEALVLGNTLLAPKSGDGQMAALDVGPTEHAVKVEPIEGSPLKRLILTKHAVERLDLKTMPLGQEEVVRMRVFSGEVELVPEPKKLPELATNTTGATASDAEPLRVRVNLGTESQAVVATKAALVSKLDDEDDDSDDDDISADPQAADDEDGDDKDDAMDGKAAMVVRYFLLKGGSHGLVAGERVSVKLPTTASGQIKLVVPYSAIIYDTKAQAWVYTSPAALTFVRQPVEIDFIEGNKVVLVSGPALATPIVTVGVAELWGAEAGMGH